MGSFQMEEKPISIQVCSDIHLDCPGIGRPSISANADYLLLAGDIGRAYSSSYRVWLCEMAEKFEKVIFVAGNHEYYNKPGAPAYHPGKTMTETDNYLEQMSAQINKQLGEERVVYLGGVGKSVTIDKYRVIGGTLWSHIPAEEEAQALYLMRDYHAIYSREDHLITPSETTTLHRRTIDFMTAELMKPNSPPTIMLTHHAPLLEALEGGSTDLLHCYCSNLEKMAKFPIAMWIFGHTHIPFDKTINGVRFLSRPWARDKK
jgi:predicted phosphodiesterase